MVPNGSKTVPMDDWRGRGLIREPKSKKQFDRALAAKEFVEGRKCYEQIREMMVAGRSDQDVAHVIVVEKEESGGRLLGTVRKYVNFYRNFCIPPLQLIKVMDETPPTRPLVRIAMSTSERIREIEMLEELSEMNLQRILEQRELEKFFGGLPLPGLKAELEQQRALVDTLRNMKSDLGVAGYERRPVGLDLTLRRGADRRFDLLTEPERKQVVDTMTQVMQIIDLKPVEASDE